ncbi:Outward-rectifier potassium channel TOK1 OS=Saccharomyces cerevisiae (strain ATCC 204508 / S288c) GN=TOK1 PE=1 SV=1 [Rhizoctonia solani AG-1 IB]|uniref:Outward-rectifier potassium channel TOK1 n=1 Tax=Thanatephorus cucumeris (strain AG1-IB / isolate 7/3/14) TaxID=1108050 RepID=A0A0B7FCT2_THACB|nr:Outward-rectifier potassium channel TOK1 OS=Saccharomyces cerevisiae (strain ATCC 204508 / S288c) GN=TOK1 PE=1 SV=1 [Rhizoctonia solani AG-1 IB]
MTSRPLAHRLGHQNLARIVFSPSYRGQSPMPWPRLSRAQVPKNTSAVSFILRPLYLFASVSPLTAAVIAPLAVLLDIPALTEKWYTRNGQPQSDPRASLILSGLSLGFSLVANALLVIRFSLQGRKWMIATQMSVACWLVKVATGITNLVVFGALTRNQPQFSYAEGFWSAVVSLVASGIVLALLLLHWALEFKRNSSHDNQPTTPAHTKIQIRVAGRHFMLQNTMLTALIALTALIFSRIEEWTYLQGIYFTIVTFLTVGFGDFYPTKPSTKVLVFPLGLLGITLLANCITMIVSFFSKHQKKHKAQVRAEREKEWQISQMKSENPSLEREVEFLSQLHDQQGWREQGVDLAQSLLGFLVFWFAGAAIFGAVESWSYGDGLYFCYVFFLSIGYGDFAPISPAGRVIFIVYSIIAVPIMASFAVQAVQNILERLSNRRMDRRRARFDDQTTQVAGEALSEKKDPEKGPTDESIDEMHSTLVSQFYSKTRSEKTGTDVAMNTDDLKDLLEHAVSLERVVRRLLVAHLEEGSPPQILLRADWNLQSRDLRILESEARGNGNGHSHDGNGLANDSKSHGVHENKALGLAATEAGIAGTTQSREEEKEAEIAEIAVGGMDDEETLKAVREFRRHVAGMLALGSRLRELEGTEKYMFERRRRGD